MALAEILGSLKLTAARIAEYAPFGRTLAKAFGLAASPKAGPAQGVFARFLRDWIKGHPGTTRAAAAEMYRLGKYYSNPGPVLSQLSPQATIDRRLAATLPLPADKDFATQEYRYHVFITGTWPGDVHTTTFDVWTFSKDLLSPDAIHEQAVDDLVRNMEGDSPKVILRMYQAGKLKFEIKEFVRFTQETP